MIETTNLCKKYGAFTALDTLNLTIERGDCFGFIGPNGAGKTTTIKILATLLKPTSGQARIDGMTVGRDNRKIRPMLGYVPDFMGAYDDILVAEYLEFFGSAYGMHGAARTKAVAEALELTDLTHKASDQVNALSRGMQQRLSVARVLLHDPAVLLMDEPASGLDPRARVEMRELLKELRRMGKTILISSHILSELSELCNVIGIIERGCLLYNGSVQDALAKARVEHAVNVTLADGGQRAAELLKETPGILGVEVRGGEKNQELRVVFRPEAGADLSDIPSRLVNAGFRIRGFTEEAIDLEAAFMRLTKGLVQ